MSDRACLRLRIHGLVQGVGFRFAMQKEAIRLGVCGWVRNRLDGSVEAVAAGERHRVEALAAWARRGPPAARVVRIEIAEEAGSYASFEQLPTPE
jgi:acylphosphatase